MIPLTPINFILVFLAGVGIGHIAIFVFIHVRSALEPK